MNRRIEIRVIPNSSRDEVIEDEPEGLIVRVKASPEKGRANRAVIKLLEKHFNATVKLIAGAKSRRKVVEIEDES